MTTRTPSCDWVRTRLPLEIEPNGDGSGEASGLDAKERSRIARHLAECAPCRRHRAELADALAVLSAVAAIPPVEPDSPSLWAGLERRILEHEQKQTQPVQGAFPLSRPTAWTGFLFDRRTGNGPFRSGLRTRLARFPGEALEWGDAVLDRCRDFLPEREIRVRPGVAFGGLLAALACGVFALQADRAQSRSRLEMAQGARPIAELVTHPEKPVPPSDSEFGSEIDLAAEDGGNRWLWHSTFDDNAAEESHSGLPGPLAQAEIHPQNRPHAASASGGGGGNSGSGSSTASTSSSASTKYDYYDLERGTPMAPDARDAKSAY